MLVVRQRSRFTRTQAQKIWCKRIFGEFSESEPVLIKKDKSFNLQGPDSKAIKFGKVLCSDCNNSTSKPFDLAYEKFQSSISSNYEKILETGVIDFGEITNVNSLGFKLNVLRYLVKSFCCRLAENQIFIDPLVLEFLNGNQKLSLIHIHFEIRPDAHAFITKTRNETGEGANLYLSPLNYVKQPNGEYSLTYQYYNVQWLRIYTFYGSALTEENYSGLSEYYNSLIVPAKARYSVHPKEIYEGYTSQNWSRMEKDDSSSIEDYLSMNYFQKLS